MRLYCITYNITIDRSGNKKRFFCYAKAQAEAVRRFIMCAGLSKSYVISVHIVAEE